MVKIKLGVLLACFFIGAPVRPVFSQATPALTSVGAQSPASNGAEQTAYILGLTAGLKHLAEEQRSRTCDAAASLVELSLRQQLSESIQAATLDVDRAVAELSNEQGELSNLRTTLQMKRDKAVSKYNTAALITGSGAGAAVSATELIIWVAAPTMSATVSISGQASPRPFFR